MTSSQSNLLQNRTVRSLWRCGHWCNTSRNAKALSHGARILTEFLTVKPEFSSLYVPTTNHARNYCFDLCKKTKLWVINLDRTKNRSHYCLVPTLLGRVNTARKTWQSGFIKRRIRTLQPQDLAALHKMYTRWRAPWYSEA